jgi:hypothetical protein
MKDGPTLALMVEQALLTDAQRQKQFIKGVRKAHEGSKTLDGISDEQILQAFQKEIRASKVRRIIGEAIKDAELNGRNILDKSEDLGKAVAKARESFATDPTLTALTDAELSATITQHMRTKHLGDAAYARVKKELKANPGSHNEELKALCKAVGDTRGKNALLYYKLNKAVFRGEFIVGVDLNERLLQDLWKIQRLKEQFGRAGISVPEFDQRLCRPFGYKIPDGQTHRTAITTIDGGTVRYDVPGRLPQEPSVSIQNKIIKEIYQEQWLDALEQLTLRGKR